MRELDASEVKKVRTLQEFDDIFTGPIHGFKNAIDYYTQSSSLKVVTNISNTYTHCKRKK
jgi:predicted alpha/beta-fold hydrolase